MKSLILGMLISIIPTFAFAEEGAADPALTLQEVQCRGNEATSCPFITGHLYLANGAVINEEELQNAKLRLSLLVNFKSVDIRLEKGAEKNKAIVVIDVVEASPVTKEVVLGTSVEGEHVSQRVAARTSYNNLFGAGKILDLELDFRVPIGEPGRQSESVRIQYVDPHLFGSAKNFMIAGAEYEKSSFNSSYYNYKQEQVGLDLHFGRRFNNFSYFTVGYQNRPVTTRESKYKDFPYPSPGSVYEYSSTGYRSNVIVTTGWNSEDDPYFATRGDRAHWAMRWSSDGGSGLLENSLRVGVAYRRTWKTSGGSIWYYNIGGAPRNEFRPNLDEQMDISFGYARDFGKSDFLGGINRGRWYIEPGLPRSYSTFDHGSIGVKTGLRLDTELLGIVDIYAFAANGFVGREQ